jgi:hypothetical protein
MTTQDTQIISAHYFRYKCLMRWKEGTMYDELESADAPIQLCLMEFRTRQFHIKNQGIVSYHLHIKVGFFQQAC